MTNHGVRFPQGARHGWYLGRDEGVGLLPGRERDWPAVWSRYSERTGHRLQDLVFVDDEQCEEFRRDVEERGERNPTRG